MRGLVGREKEVELNVSVRVCRAFCLLSMSPERGHNRSSY